MNIHGNSRPCLTDCCGLRSYCLGFGLITTFFVILAVPFHLYGAAPAAQDPLSAGKAAFERVCGLCHGPQGRGDIGPALVPMTHDVNEVLDIAREGRGMMPQLSSKTITDADIVNVVQYLKSLSAVAPSSEASKPSPSPAVLQFGSRVERAVIGGDLAALVRASADGSDLVGQPLEASDKKFVYYTEAYANWGLSCQTTDREKSLRALEDGARQAHDALGLDDKFVEGYILAAIIEAKTLAMKPNGTDAAAQAYASLDRARALDPLNPRLMLAQGIADFLTPRAGADSTEAEKALRGAGAQFQNESRDRPIPNWGHAESFAWLGLVLQKKGDISGARQAYQHALAIEPDFKWVSGVLLPALNQ
jgi:tetratricopeptide (TPR) repeat protein